MVYCERVFCLCQKGWKVSKCFLLRMRKPRITFLLFPKPKRGDWGGTPKQKLKTIEVVFVYSKRSTGIWYCEKFQRPGKTSGTRNCDQNYSVFPSFKYFFLGFKKGLVELLLWKIQRSFLLKRIVLHNNKLKENNNF